MWNDELATIAQRWADQCTYAHDKTRLYAIIAIQNQTNQNKIGTN